MVPTVAQQLAAVRHTIAKTIVPALDPDAGFAQEQAGLILATLDWVLDVQASEHRYELVEHADARELLSALVALGPSGVDDAPAALEESADVPADLAGIRAQTLRLKRLSEEAFETLTATSGTPGSDAALRLLSAQARRQLVRENAWFRMTGFPQSVEGDIAATLAGQAAPARTAA